jgi:hypothetical protein
MEGDAAMDMSVGGASLASRIASDRGFTAISHYFVMDWAAIWKDIVVGLLLAGALVGWVPEAFWQSSKARGLVASLEDSGVGP